MAPWPGLNIYYVLFGLWGRGREGCRIDLELPGRARGEGDARLRAQKRYSRSDSAPTPRPPAALTDLGCSAAWSLGASAGTRIRSPIPIPVPLPSSGRAKATSEAGYQQPGRCSAPPLQMWVRHTLCDLQGSGHQGRPGTFLSEAALRVRLGARSALLGWVCSREMERGVILFPQGSVSALKTPAGCVLR